MQNESEGLQKFLSLMVPLARPDRDLSYGPILGYLYCYRPYIITKSNAAIREFTLKMQTESPIEKP